MAYETIRKPSPERLPVRPHLTDWEAARRDFTWDAHRARLAGLPGGAINIAHECLDRHAAGSRGASRALVWAGKRGEEETYTFGDLKALSDRFGAGLRALGCARGDRVFVFLDRIPELYVAVFGTLKAGAVISPLFSAFGPDAVRDRIADAGAVALVTTPTLLSRIASCLPDLPTLRHIIVVEREGPMDAAGSAGPARIRWSEVMKTPAEDFRCEPTKPNDWAVMHYTSGTTGKPKGAAHVHEAILGHHATARWALDLHEEDIYWCTADPGWVTGTSYGMFGPWSNGVTSIVYEGGFDPDTWYGVIARHRVTVWYTAPTALRMLMKAGEEIPARHDLSTLRHICSVGEPLNPEAVVWGEKVFGLPIHDNWWQTETGCIQIANYPAQDIRPGSMGRPTPGTTAAVVDDDGREVPDGEEGHLALRPGWPSMFRTYWNRKDLYDSRFRNGWYYSGDRARRDADGYFWFVGRADDVINTAGHLVGPFEVESALIEHPAIAEAGVIGKPDQERMEIVKAFVSLKDGFTPSPDLEREIKQFVRTRLAAHAYPREIEFLPTLPKTRSGKIMRRLLKARELGQPEGDTSTLED